MKKIHALLIIMSLYQFVFAQENIGINTTSPQAVLDISSNDEGVLLPRIALSSTNQEVPLTTPSWGELVFNTATAGTGSTAVTPGFYFWNGVAWTRLKAGTMDDDHDWHVENTTDIPGSIENNIYTNGKVGIGVMSPAERLSVYPNTDNSAEIGYAHIGFMGHSGFAGFSHRTFNNPSQYALLQDGSGRTILNSPLGQSIQFRYNNNNVGAFYFGNFGVGTVTPSSKVEVVGDVRLNGVNSGIIYESKETNEDWRLVYSDNFEGGTESWISNGSLSTGDEGLTVESNNVAGLVGKFIRPTDNNYTLKKFFSTSGVSYSEVKVEFNYLFLDSWDNESGWAAVKSSEGGNPTPVWSQQHNHDWADLKLNGTSYNISFFGSGGFSDLKSKQELQFSWSGNGFWIEFGANLDTEIYDETFGIDNVMVYVR